jgi:ubiquitin-protein ligase
VTLEAPGDLFVISRDDDDDDGGGGGGDGPGGFEGQGGGAGGAHARAHGADEHEEEEARRAALLAEWRAALAARGEGEGAGEEEAAEPAAGAPPQPPQPPQPATTTTAAPASAPAPTATATQQPAAPPVMTPPSDDDGAGGGLPGLASTDEWPAFDTFEGPPTDHAFGTPAPPAAAAPRIWARTITKEWGVLRTGLPAGTAWARGWEGRMDLARFALAGAPGTPYHDHLFLFDVAFPPDYPAAPPRLAYHAYGVRVNPNLYACGKVCLSLLGTWAGSRPGEAWEPGTSTLLQVIVSIQGLVLVDEPYYQEAGYEKQAAGGSEEAAKNARLYSESAFLAAARAALGLLRRPPAGFAPLIRAHYKARRGAYLAACRQYVAGRAGIGAARVSGEGGDGGGGEGDAPGGSAPPQPAGGKPGPPPPTEGFRLMLKDLLPTLEEALGEL